MGLADRLTLDLREAMRSGDTVRRSAIRMIRSALQNAEIARRGPLDEQAELEVLAREVRQRRESIEEFRKGARPDLVEKEEADLGVLLGYLPQQMSREEIVLEARRVMNATGARGPADRGKMMGQLMPRLRGRADGRDVNQVVTELLQG